MGPVLIGWYLNGKNGSGNRTGEGQFVLNMDPGFRDLRTSLFYLAQGHVLTGEQ